MKQRSPLLPLAVIKQISQPGIFVSTGWIFSFQRQKLIFWTTGTPIFRNHDAPSVYIMIGNLSNDCNSMFTCKGRNPSLDGARNSNDLNVYAQKLILFSSRPTTSSIGCFTTAFWRFLWHQKHPLIGRFWSMCLRWTVPAAHFARSKLLSQFKDNGNSNNAIVSLFFNLQSSKKTITQIPKNFISPSSAENSSKTKQK